MKSNSNNLLAGSNTRLMAKVQMKRREFFLLLDLLYTAENQIFEERNNF
jgi:hypothetical protein